MKKIPKNQKGFTLLEVIVVLAVLGALAAILAPSVFRYIDDANIAKARQDVNGMAAAINKMYKDTGRWPFYEDGDGNLPYESGTDPALLTSNSSSCSAVGCSDTTLPDDDTTGDTWGLGGIKDSIANHLITNTPLGSALAAKKYATTGSRAWLGPYLNQVHSLDTWGRSYVINVPNADPSVASASQQWFLVISAGPDGQLDTDSNELLTTNTPAVGDAIVSRVR